MIFSFDLNYEKNSCSACENFFERKTLLHPEKKENKQIFWSKINSSDFPHSYQNKEFFNKI